MAERGACQASGVDRRSCRDNEGGERERHPRVWVGELEEEVRFELHPEGQIKIAKFRKKGEEGPLPSSGSCSSSPWKEWRIG